MVETIVNEYWSKRCKPEEPAPLIDTLGNIQDDATSWVIDPSSRAKSVQKEGKLYSMFDEYSDNGIWAELGENDVDAGINRVAEYFKAGKIKIFSTCTHLIHELERYHWSEQKEGVRGELKPMPYKSDDHLVDCLRYLVMSRQSKAEIKLKRFVHPNSAWAKAEAIRKRREDMDG